jgi:pyruvate/2-oxoglutarate dehydrogenase complex dihydrolipoamide dehydrogenase (E3) component/uncharacterized membrane protein YdjX (TVP38/TMEM64 family)
MKTRQLILLLCLIAAVVMFVALDLSRYLSLAYLQQSQQAFGALYAQHPWQVGAAYFGVYVLVTALSLPGAVVLTLAGGAGLGLLWGTLLVSFASTVGATLAMLSARYLLRGATEKRFASRLAEINQGVQRDGGFYLFSLRLIPVVPFFALNLLMGLTRMKTWTFYWVSQLGMLAGTLAYVNAGTQLAQIDSLHGVLSPAVLGSFALLGVLPLLARKGLAQFRRRQVYARWKGQRPRQFDRNLIVIGAGAGGLVTAYIAAAVKARVTLVEAHKMGGDCLNYGCVPSKSLIQSARLAQQMRQASRYGLQDAAPQFSFKAVMQRIHAVIAAIEPHDSVARYTALGVEVLQGHARIVNPWTVEITLAGGGTQRLSTRSIVIAAGAQPLLPDVPGLSDADYVTSDTLWERFARLDALPQRLLVLGGGPVGCELAQAFARLGSQVTQVDRGERLLPREDADVSALVQAALTADGVSVLNGQQVLRCENDPQRPGGRQLVLQDLQTGALSHVAFDQLICAIGRRARLSGYGLEELGIPTGATVQTNEYLQTIYPNIYAAGDVAGPYQLTHAAAHQAWYAAVNALFGGLKKFKVDHRVIPRVTFVDPEVACVGLNEQEALAQGVAVEVTRFHLDELDRAIADGRTQGFVKVLTVPGKDTIVGVTIVGSQAGELLAEYVLAMKHGLGLNKILGTIHSYPTMAEANKYAAGSWKRAHQPERLLAWLRKYHDFMRG